MPVILKSSNVSTVDYNDATAQLSLTFRNSTTRYIYDQVPRTIFTALITSHSPGGYVHKNIKGKYKFTKIEQLKA